MSYGNKPLLTDSTGKPIPQYWDEVSDAYKPLADLKRVFYEGSLTDFKTKSITVSTSPIEMTTGMTGKKQLVIYPPQSAGQVVYWGNADVTTNSGAPLNYGDNPVIFDFADSTLRVFCVASTSTPVRIVESK